MENPSLDEFPENQFPDIENPTYGIAENDFQEVPTGIKTTSYSHPLISKNDNYYLTYPLYEATTESLSVPFYDETNEALKKYFNNFLKF